MSETPRVMSEVTAEWLSSVLGCRVASIRVEIIGAGEGFMGQLARVHLTGTGCPSSVIVKMPTADPGGQMIGQMMRVWEREHRFYTEVAPHMHGVRIAECLYSRTDPYVLILEDLHPRRPGDQVAGPTADQARTAIDTAADLHGSWFDHPELKTLDWMPDISDPMSLSVGAMFDMGWPTFLARYGDSLPERVLRWCEGFAPRVTDWMTKYLSWPNTLIHGDFRLDNMFFDIKGGAEPIAVLDWQTVAVGNPMMDIGYFMGTGIGDDLRRAHEGELLDLYCAEMTARGVPLSRDAIWDDYVLGALHGISTAVFSAAYVERTERGDANFLSMARGGCALALQHGSLAKLKG